MKRTDIHKIFTGRKKALAGCLAAVIVLAGGFNVWQSSQVPEFPDFTDPVVETTITEDDTPLASKPKVTTKTTSNTKTTRKKVKLKKAATKTYTKKLPTTNKKSTTTKKTNRNTTVKTLKTVKTATTQKYTKKSKNSRSQTRKVTTTIQTTTTVMAASATAGKANAASTKKVESINMDSKYSVSNIASIAPKMDSRVLKAYKKLGFTVTIDPSVNYGGCFNAHSRSIILRFENETIYHELGHFLAFVAGNVDRTSDFAAVYNSEKSKFTGINRSYATQNSSEYFAESVLEYVTSPSTLKRQRPKTYAAIVAALNKITDERIQRVMDIYGPFWS